MEQPQRFEEYVEYLRDNFINLVEYGEKTGTLEQRVRDIKEALFDKDPFVVFGASIVATLVLTDKSIYH